MENNVATLLVILLADLFVYRTFAKSLYDNDITNDKRIYIGYASIVAFIYVIARSFVLKHGDEVEMLVCIIFLLLISDTGWRRKIWITVSTIVSITLIQQFVFFFLDIDILYRDFIDFGALNITMAIIVIAVAFVIKIIRVNIRKRMLLGDVPQYLYLSIIFGFCAVIFPLLVMFNEENAVPFKLKSVVIAISYIGLLCGAISCLLFMKNRNEKIKYYNENKMKEKMLTLQQSHYEDIVKSYEAIRLFKHDIKGHLRVLAELERNKEYKKLHNYMSKLQDTLDTYKVFQCDNVYVGAIINSFNEDIKRNSIDFHVEYSINGSLTMDSMDICSLIHNLVSNAIEETCKVDKHRRKIVLRIISIYKNIIIEISNPISDTFTMDNIELGLTTKHDKSEHGLGLLNIHQIVDSYDGNIKYTEKENTLKASVVLQDVVQIDQEEV